MGGGRGAQRAPAAGGACAQEQPPGCPPLTLMGHLTQDEGCDADVLTLKVPAGQGVGAVALLAGQ